MATDSKTNTVLVYVRLCGDSEDRDCRELSFQIPEKLSQTDLLDEGFAIDGNSAMQSVTAYTNLQTEEFVPLGDALLGAQRHLVQWLGTRGYAVEFK